MHASLVLLSVRSKILLGRNFSIEFVDSQGSRLTGIDSGFGLRVEANLRHRAQEMDGKLEGQSTKVVVGGQANFVSLFIQNLAGRDMSLMMREVSSKLRAKTASFTVYPFALHLSQHIVSSTAGSPLAVAVQMHDQQAKVQIFYPYDF